MFASRAWEIFIFYYHLTLSCGHLNCTSPAKVKCAADALHDKVSLSLSISVCDLCCVPNIYWLKLVYNICQGDSREPPRYIVLEFKRTLSDWVFCYRLAPFYNSGPTYHESLSNHWESGAYSLFQCRLQPSSLVHVRLTFASMIKSFLYFLSICLHVQSVVEQDELPAGSYIALKTVAAATPIPMYRENDDLEIFMKWLQVFLNYLDIHQLVGEIYNYHQVITMQTAMKGSAQTWFDTTIQCGSPKEEYCSYKLYTWWPTCSYHQPWQCRHNDNSTK